MTKIVSKWWHFHFCDPVCTSNSYVYSKQIICHVRVTSRPLSIIHIQLKDCPCRGIVILITSCDTRVSGAVESLIGWHRCDSVKWVLQDQDVVWSSGCCENHFSCSISHEICTSFCCAVYGLCTWLYMQTFFLRCRWLSRRADSRLTPNQWKMALL